MKPMSVLAVCAASFALVATAACHKDEPASETNTTSAPLTPDQPVVTPIVPTVTTGTMDNGAAVQPQNITGSRVQPNGMAPTGGTDLNSTSQTSPSTPPDQMQNQQLNNQNLPKDQKNHSTTLGDSKSGEYTGGYGTNGGKATWGTGPQKNTQMGKPTPATP